MALGCLLASAFVSRIGNTTPPMNPRARVGADIEVCLVKLCLIASNSMFSVFVFVFV